jgi:tetratricopeptide (TPR) repeat protein
MLVARPRSIEAVTARTALAGAIATYEAIGGDRHAYAMAKLALVDDELERYLALAFPADLDFEPSHRAASKASEQRFAAWVAAKTELGKRLRSRYDAIAAFGDPIGAVVATSRSGTVAVTFADALFSAEIPTSVRTGSYAREKTDNYCDTLTTFAERMETEATQAFTSCVMQARVHAFDPNLREIVDAAHPCIEALSALQSSEFPSLDEVFDAPERARMQMRLGIGIAIDAGRDYDELNTRGVALRIQRDFVRARDAYQRAIALDDLRPEAHFNLALLETSEATTADVQTATARYQRAYASFTRAAARATGQLHADAMKRAHDSAHVFHQIQDFMAQN